MSNNIQSNILPVPWGNGITYHFRYTAKLRSLRCDRFKAVYYGCFVDKAPDNLEPGVYYYLKNIHVVPNDHTYNNIPVGRYPQTREKYELLEFDAQCFRRILEKNVNAKNIGALVREGSDVPEDKECYIVERPYKVLPNEESSSDSYVELEKLTPYERLDYLAQICKALIELYKQKIGGTSIVAYRDLKLANCLIEPGDSRFTVVLTDFATIRLRDDDAPEAPSSAAAEPVFSHVQPPKPNTDPYIMSRENTAPENLDPSMTIDEKIDVYALGHMLASLFGYFSDICRNPNRSFCKPYLWNRATEGDDALTTVFHDKGQADERLTPNTEGNTWQTLAMGDTFNWGDHDGAPNPPSSELLDEIRLLFFHSTRYDPANRCSLMDFYNKIVELRRSCDRVRSKSRILYKIPETVCFFLQDDLENTRPHLTDAVESLEDWPARIDWYDNNVELSAPSDAHSDFSGMDNLHLDSDSLKNAIKARLSAAPVCTHSITDVLDRIRQFYTAKKYEYWFGGNIHIFSCEEILPRYMQPLYDKNRKKHELSLLFEDLWKLKHYNTDNLSVWLHTAVQPQNPPVEIRDHFYPIRITAPTAAPPVPKIQYLTGSEGLFFIKDNNKVYVSRLTPRERK